MAMFKRKLKHTTLVLAFLGLSLAGAGQARAVVLTESFSDPLGGFYGRWLGTNTNMGSYYLANGISDPDYRGNNPAGLWIAQCQTVGCGTSGPTVDITFDPGFGAMLTSLSFQVEAFTRQRISIFDIGGNVLFSQIIKNGSFPLDHPGSVSASSANGIGRILFDSTGLGNGQVSGNTSVDSFRANVADVLTLAGVAGFSETAYVPEPTTIALLGMGLVGMGFARRRRRNA